MPEGNEPLPMDNEMRSLQKINDQLGGGSGGGGGAPGLKEVFSGNGSPVGIVTPIMADAIYIQTDSVPANQVWTYDNGAWNVNDQG